MATRSVREQAATVVAAWDGAVGRPDKAVSACEDAGDRVDVAARLSWIGDEVELLRRALAADRPGDRAARIADVIRAHPVDAASGRCACGDPADRWPAHVADAILGALGLGPGSALTS